MMKVIAPLVPKDFASVADLCSSLEDLVHWIEKNQEWVNEYARVGEAPMQP